MVRRAWWMPNPETILEDLLRAASNTRRRNDPQSLEHVERVKEGKRKARERRLAERNARRPPPKPKPEAPVLRILRAMEPGRWYGLKELGRAVGVDHDQANSVSCVLRKKRWADRAANPGWDPTPVQPQVLQGGGVREPKWLWRLSAGGEARQLWM